MNISRPNQQLLREGNPLELQLHSQVPSGHHERLAATLQPRNGTCQSEATQNFMRPGSQRQARFKALGQNSSGL